MPDIIILLLHILCILTYISITLITLEMLNLVPRYKAMASLSRISCHVQVHVCRLTSWLDTLDCGGNILPISLFK